MRLEIALIVASLLAPVSTMQDVLGQAAGAALQADAPRALALLKDVDPSTLAEKDRQFVICMRQRFGSGGPEIAAETPSANVSDRVLALYREHWRTVMLQPPAREAEERRLQDNLRKLLGAPAGSSMDLLEEQLKQALKKEGLYSLQGRTGLLRELMIWARQDTRAMRVELPEGPHEVKVELLDGFKSMGWGYYAACGRRGAGGWATKDALFAIVPRYESLDSEEFRVSFLGHEAQHFADLRRFNDLKPWELEYRAKLVELALAKATREKVVRKFAEDQGNDPSSPHSYANRQLLGELTRRLGLRSAEELLTVDVTKLQATAAEMLREDSRRRLKKD